MTTTLAPPRINFHDAMRLDLPDIDLDGVRVSRFDITPEQARFSRLRAAIGGGRGSVEAGTYTRLDVDGILWMSDTPDERRDHSEAFYQAQRRGGRVLIHGLGLGMVVKAVLELPQVEHVDVVELDPRIIAAIGPHYAGERCTIHEGDALTHVWPTGTRWNVVWHDIWPTITGDNLDDMRRLHRRFGRRTDWQGSWARHECERRAW